MKRVWLYLYCVALLGCVSRPTLQAGYIAEPVAPKSISPLIESDWQVGRFNVFGGYEANIGQQRTPYYGPIIGTTVRIF